MNYIINTATGEVTRDSDGGTVVAPAQSIDDPLYVEYMAWIAAGNTPVEYTPPTEEVPDTRITVLALRNRFTTDEKIAIDLASIDNPAATIENRKLSAMIRVTLFDLAAATYVDLAREDTVAGIWMFETAGIIGPGRADQILLAPIQPIEQPI